MFVRNCIAGQCRVLQCYSITVLQSYIVTVLQSNIVTVLQCCSVTVLQSGGVNLRVTTRKMETQQPPTPCQGPPTSESHLISSFLQGPIGTTPIL